VAQAAERVFSKPSSDDGGSSKRHVSRNLNTDGKPTGHFSQDHRTRDDPHVLITDTPKNKPSPKISTRVCFLTNSRRCRRSFQ